MSLGSSPLAPVASAVMAGVGNALVWAGQPLLPAAAAPRWWTASRPSPAPARAQRARDRGYYRLETYTTTTSGARYVARMEQRGDPGYKATSVLLGECGLALALDRDKLSDLRGVLTPAAAMGDALLARLPAAGVTLRTERLD